LLEQGIDIPVILITGMMGGSLAIRAMQMGAADYLTKPFTELDEVLIAVQRVLEYERLKRAVAETTPPTVGQNPTERIVGSTPEMIDIFKLVGRVARTPATVLITGETGTGKELVARALHALGPRSDRPLIVVSCARLASPAADGDAAGRLGPALAGGALERSLFEQADGATLFLDEIGDLPFSVQAQLVRALEHGDVACGGGPDARPVDLVAIASTNRELSAEAAKGRFRRDLYDRLSVVHLPVAPLRDRRDDIPPLTMTFLSEFSGSIRRVSGIAASAERLLEGMKWPGNVRQLRSVLQRACLRTEEDVLSERTIAAALSRSQIQAIAYRHSIRPLCAAGG
jgi:DNA-binding NtrC family response regulator